MLPYFSIKNTSHVTPFIRRGSTTGRTILLSERQSHQTITSTALRLAFLGILVWTASTLSAQQPPKPIKRAKLPVPLPRPTGIFFENALEEGLNGPRPANFGTPPTPDSKTPPSDASNTETSESPVTEKGQWASLIRATTIEDELKAIEKRSADALQNEGHFKGQGYLQLQQDFHTAAILFGIIEAYDGDVRWQRDARAMRDAMALSASHARVASVQVFREAKQRHAELQDLIRGSSLSERPAPSENGWADIADRRVIMQRLEVSVQQQLAPWLASSQEFRKHQAEIAHQAEVTSALAHVLTLEGMTDAGSDDYDGWSRKLEAAASAMARAAQEDQYSAAREAHGQATKSCTECHGVYRSE